MNIWDLFRDPTGSVVLSVVGLVALLVALVIVLYVARLGRGGAYTGALVATGVTLPPAAALLTLLPFMAGAGAASIAIGTGAALALWLLIAAALRSLTGPDTLNPTVHCNLRERLGLLQARVEGLCPEEASASQVRHASQGPHAPQAAGTAGRARPEAEAAAIARRQVCELVRAIKDELCSPGHLRWVVGSGYLHAWNLVHRAEEALLDLDPVETVLRGAYYDRLRLLGAGEINYHESLLSHLVLAVEALCPAAKDYFVDPPGQDRRPAGGMVGVAAAGAAGPSAGPARPGLPGLRAAPGPFGVARTVPRTVAAVAGPPPIDPASLARSSPNGSATPAAGQTGATPGAGAALLAAAAPASIPPAPGQQTALLPGPLRTTLSSAPLGALSPTEARAILREIRRAVNEFRDDRWSGLVRARNRLLAAVIFTGLTAYLLLALAVAMDARREVIAGMGAFYLVGAVVGLFNRMHADAGTEAAVAAVEDYGFSWAQLMHTPLFSGLAALGGVALLALLPAVAPAPGPLVGSPTPAATGTPVAPPAPVMRQVPATPPLGDIFDLTRNPVGLLVAAVFGLTPSLLTDRLRQQAENYKADLRSTQASNRQPVLGRT